MRAEIFSEERFSAGIGAEALLSNSHCDNFNYLTNLLQLDPKVDFQNSNLRDVDFSGADLRHHDFRGADLRGSNGVGIKLDSTTLFGDADVDGSVFAHVVNQARFFEGHPEWDREFRRVKDNDWLGVGEWMAGKLDAGAPREADTRIVARLYETTRETSVQSTILYYSAFGFHERSEYRDFLLHILTNQELKPALIKTSLRILVSLHSADRIVFSHCLKFLASPDHGIRTLALAGIFNSGRISEVRTEIRSIMQNEPAEEVRREFVGHMARQRGATHVNACWEPFGSGHYIDFRNRLFEDTLESIAEAWLRREKMARILSMPPQQREPGMGEIRRTEILVRVHTVREALSDLQGDGVPFKLDPHSPPEARG